MLTRRRPARGDETRWTLGGDKGYDAADFVEAVRVLGVTPHVAQNTSNRRSAVDRPCIAPSKSVVFYTTMYGRQKRASPPFSVSLSGTFPGRASTGPTEPSTFVRARHERGLKSSMSSLNGLPKLRSIATLSLAPAPVRQASRSSVAHRAHLHAMRGARAAFSRSGSCRKTTRQQATGGAPALVTPTMRMSLPITTVEIE